MNNKRNIIIGALCVVIFILGLFCYLNSSNLQRDSELMQLFEKEYSKQKSKTIAELRDEAIREYILRCCYNEKLAIKMLDDNEFDINIVDDHETVKNLNKHYAFSKKRLNQRYPEYEIVEYDKFVFARKDMMLWRKLLYSPVTFEIILHLQNGDIQWVTANIEQFVPIED